MNDNLEEEFKEKILREDNTEGAQEDRPVKRDWQKEENDAEEFND